MAKIKVALLNAAHDDILYNYESLLELIEAKDHLDDQFTTVLKPAVNWNYAYPGVNTPPWQLEGTICALRMMGFRYQASLETSSVAACSQRADENLQLAPVLKHYLVPRLNNTKSSDMVSAPYKSKGELLVLDKLFEKGVPLPDFLTNKNMVYLPTLRTDALSTVGGAAVLALEAILGEGRYRTLHRIHEALVDCLMIQKEVLAGSLTVMDATMAASGGGPRQVNALEKNLILASADPVAADAVAALLMGLDPMSIPYLRLAHERGVGIADPAEIEIIGDGLPKDNPTFELTSDPLMSAGQMVAEHAADLMTPLLERRGLRMAMREGIRQYHDNYLWRSRMKKEFKTWRKKNAWGKLFKEYMISGHIEMGSDLANSDPANF